MARVTATDNFEETESTSEITDSSARANEWRAESSLRRKRSRGLQRWAAQNHRSGQRSLPLPLMETTSTGAHCALLSFHSRFRPHRILSPTTAISTSGLAQKCCPLNRSLRRRTRWSVLSINQHCRSCLAYRIANRKGPRILRETLFDASPAYCWLHLSSYLYICSVLRSSRRLSIVVVALLIKQSGVREVASGRLFDCCALLGCRNCSVKSPLLRTTGGVQSYALPCWA